MRKLKVNIENCEGNHHLNPVWFSSDKTTQDDWVEDYIKSTNVIFIYSEFNPRTKEDGSDNELEAFSQDFEMDRLALNHNGMIGKVVDYYVDPDTTLSNESSIHDHLIVCIEGVQFNVGFDEIEFTTRKNKNQPRKVVVDVYQDLTEHKVQFIKDAWLKALPSMCDNINSDYETIVADVIGTCMKQVSGALRNSYTYVGQRKMEVPYDYKGEYALFINASGIESLK